MACIVTIRLSEIHKKTGAELASNGIVGRNLGTKQKVTSQIRHQSSFELRKGELLFCVLTNLLKS